MNLWRRGSRFTFQKRVPADIVPLLGGTPLRIALPPCSVRSARWVASMLNAEAEVRFHLVRMGMEQEDDPRDEIIRDLRDRVAFLTALHESTKADYTVKYELGRAALLGEVPYHQVMMRQSLEQLGNAIERLKQKPKAEQPTQETQQNSELSIIMAKLTELEANFKAEAAPEEPDLPLFSVAFPDYLEHKGSVLNRTFKKSKRVQYTLPAAKQAFVEICGDRPLNAYEELDLDAFVEVLAKLPINRTKLKRFEGMSLRETGEFNSGLKKPYDTLTTSTIEAQYLSPIKDAFRWLCKRNGIRSPFADAEIEFPGYTRQAEVRHPLTRRNINLLLETAASKPRPDDHWLPLLGFLTGCRLAELVSLQGKDLVKHEDVPEWIFDLRQKIVVNGLEQDRQLKTNNARRIIALPRVLDDLGFIRWARERPSFIFDQLQRTKNPPRAASQRMQRLFLEAGIERGRGEVFHSLRHSHKTWLRALKIRDRTIDLQSGHALEGTAAKYGAKTLEPEEIAELAACQLPDWLQIPARMKR